MTEIVRFKYGGGLQARIIVDDHCYVLEHSGPDWVAATHWFCEAVQQLRDLPANPDRACEIREKYYGSYEIGSGGPVPGPPSEEE
jgi:hypothetical protein